MGFRRFLHASLLSAALSGACLGTASLALGEEECSRWYGALQRALRWPSVYLSEVRESRGVRILLAPRTPRERFNHWVWADPFAYPLTLPPEFLKSRRRASIPAQILVSAYPASLTLDWLEKRKASREEKAVLSRLPSRPGGGYLAAFVRSGEIEPSVAVAAWGAHRRDLDRWLSAPGDLSKLPPRFRELRDRGVIRTDEELRALADLAREVMDSVYCPRGPDSCTEGDLESSYRLEEAWVARLKQSGRLGGRSPLEASLLASVYRPILRLRMPDGSTEQELTDLEIESRVRSGAEEWKILAALSSELPPEAMVMMGADQIRHPAAVREKEARWRSLLPASGGTPAPVPGFARRPDLPGFSKLGVSFAGKPVVSEIELWKLAADDLRFRDLAEAYGREVLTEMGTFQGLTARTRAVDALEEGYRKNVRPSPGEACTWIRKGGETSRENEESAAGAVAIASEWRLFLAWGAKGGQPGAACRVGAFQVQERFFYELSGGRDTGLEVRKRAFAERERAIAELLRSCDRQPDPCAGDSIPSVNGR